MLHLDEGGKGYPATSVPQNSLRPDSMGACLNFTVSSNSEAPGAEELWR